MAKKGTTFRKYTEAFKLKAVHLYENGGRKRPIQDAILHSDQGFQYTSKNYSQCIKAYNMIGSHSRKGNCLDNACIESFFSHLKTETSYFSGCHSKEQLIQAIEKYIWFYNNKRFQKKLNQCAPIEYRNTLVA
ncbi:IS3 family transposase [Bacillus sp. DX4.1]|uniref:IS3 family transposase n=1 Tax=Bacillus sp. DX4.1 TaxID=3055867 RepID=UPI0025A283CE|nr:IS3 family transposase [Bacillus sp. DX4.1]MDM5186058.1 IS3 family transposase [Bacillus sp. DX4.1]